MKDTLRSMMESTRFVLLQESVLVGVTLAILKAFWKPFPLIELYSFLGPVILGALGWRTWENIQERREDTARMVGASTSAGPGVTGETGAR